MGKRGDERGRSQGTFSAEPFRSIYCLTHCQKQSDLQRAPLSIQVGQSRAKGPGAQNHTSKESSSSLTKKHIYFPPCLSGSGFVLVIYVVDNIVLILIEFAAFV